MREEGKGGRGEGEEGGEGGGGGIVYPNGGGHTLGLTVCLVGTLEGWGGVEPDVGHVLTHTRPCSTGVSRHTLRHRGPTLYHMGQASVRHALYLLTTTTPLGSRQAQAFTARDTSTKHSSGHAGPYQGRYQGTGLAQLCGLGKEGQPGGLVADDGLVQVWLTIQASCRAGTTPYHVRRTVNETRTQHARTHART